MNFLRKLFGWFPRKKTAPPLPPVLPRPAETTEPEGDPIRVFDSYGRERTFTRRQWRQQILPGILRQHHDDPDQLYQVLLQALQDGFAEDILPEAEHLRRVDPKPERGSVLLSITYKECGRFGEAAKVLNEHMARHGESGVALVNLAKTFPEASGPQTVDTLWRALLLDPNLDNGLNWYAVIFREKEGQEGFLAALRRVAALPGAWRARNWLADEALQAGDLPGALALFEEALALAPRPLEADVLQGMSGSLGKNGHLPELIRLTLPHFDPQAHGIIVGNNLIKAHLDLGQIDRAQALVDRLYSHKRLDWKSTLAFWDNEITQARISIADTPKPDEIRVGISVLGGPAWLPPLSPALELFPAKPADATVVAFLGCSYEGGKDEEKYKPHQPEAAGRFSRALPLYLAEQVEFLTTATTRDLVSRVIKPSAGFAVIPRPWEDDDASSHARQSGSPAADYVVVSHLLIGASPWTLQLRLLRTIDAACLGQVSGPLSLDTLPTALPPLLRQLLALLRTHADLSPATPPPSYQPPPDAQLSDYLYRLEQLLAIRCSAQDGPGQSSLFGERDIIDGQLELCLSQPDSVSTRLLLTSSLGALKHIRPGIVSEYRDKVERLQTKDHPLPEPAQSVINRIHASLFAS